MEVLKIKKRDLAMSKGREKLGGRTEIGCICEGNASLSFVSLSPPLPTPPAEKNPSVKSLYYSSSS